MALESARDCAVVLYRSLISLGASVGSVTKQTLLAPLPPVARPFRVCNHDRSNRRGVVAGSLQELISKTLDALIITTGIITLVLEEDGTVVDTEDFFQSLGDNTHFMVLVQGQKWKPGPDYGIAKVKQPKKMGVANITFDLYKLNPKDFIGCLNIKATFYEIYSVSYDIKCMGAKIVLRRILRFLSHVAQATGQFLLYAGTYVLQLMGDYEENLLTDAKH
ncbi:Cell death activator CIDE-A [Varanus komodoensis]|uniref:Cell death inducing DFFA like effector a n=1 Tax=Varanus komodoensis TaxID=61221 RepID=A0A8D2LU94_VARKO|nr:cell death activator CIDE-A isoform X2 [Varanus komodoensis]KAF7245182.1 Cell death activator CIDE-A [Varanus komodoensis]